MHVSLMYLVEADRWKRIGVMSLVWTRVNIERAEAIVRELQQSSRESESNRQERAEAIVRELQQSSEIAKSISPYARRE